MPTLRERNDFKYTTKFIYQKKKLEKEQSLKLEEARKKQKSEKKYVKERPKKSTKLIPTFFEKINKIDKPKAANLRKKNIKETK